MKVEVSAYSNEGRLLSSITCEVDDKIDAGGLMDSVGDFLDGENEITE
jgi:hypothetical protein